MKRTHYCGSIRRDHMGQTATLCGWVQTKRDMGGVIFLDIKQSFLKHISVFYPYIFELFSRHRNSIATNFNSKTGNI